MKSVIDALVVAMDILYKHFYGKDDCLRVFLFSNFGSEFCTDQLDVICKSLKIMKMELYAM